MREKILVIDDEPEVCRVLKEALEYEGYAVETSLSGEEALQLIQNKEYDALLVDIRLGGSTSGVSLIHYFRERPKRPALLVISATPEELLNPIFEQEGILDLVDKVMEKPSDLNPDVAPGIVKGVLRKWRKGGDDA